MTVVWCIVGLFALGGCMALTGQLWFDRRHLGAPWRSDAVNTYDP